MAESQGAAEESRGAASTAVSSFFTAERRDKKRRVKGSQEPQKRPKSRRQTRPTRGNAADTAQKDPKTMATKAPKATEVVDLLSSDSEGDADAGDKKGDCSGAEAPVVLERAREPRGELMGSERPRMWARGESVRLGTLEAGPSLLEIDDTGLKVTFPLSCVPDLDGLSGNAILRVEWRAVNDFWVCGRKDFGVPGRPILAFGFPHMLPSLHQHLDPGGLDHTKRYVVFSVDGENSLGRQGERWVTRAVMKMQDCIGGVGKNAYMNKEIADFFYGAPGAACPEELDHKNMSGVRRSLRQNNALRSGKAGVLRDPFVYPKIGDPYAVMVYPEDLTRLRGLEYLNDTLIDFYLQYLRNEAFPSRAQKVHIFSSFFYKKLAQRRSQEQREKGAPYGQTIYKRVSKWTQNVDIFKKDFLFVPINKSEHWILAVVCHPGRAFGANAGECAFQYGSEGGSPCIIMFDSLGGTHHHSAKLLNDYLTWEWRSKPRSEGCVTEEVQKFKDKVAVLHPQVPKQTNMSDCGLFLLHYAEKFISTGPNVIKPPVSSSFPNEPRARRPKRKKGILQRVRGAVGELLETVSQEVPAKISCQDTARENSSPTSWPYMFHKKWFDASEASTKRQSILELIRTIGPKLKVPCGSLGKDRLAEEMETLF